MRGFTGKINVSSVLNMSPNAFCRLRMDATVELLWYSIEPTSVRMATRTSRALTGSLTALFFQREDETMLLVFGSSSNPDQA